MNYLKDKIYIISDLHIGGEGSLSKFEAQTELIDFLDHLFKESLNKNIKLIIAGDFLNLWEITKKEGIKKFYYLENKHLDIFKAFKKISKKIKVILIPGNHDHELACYKEYPELLKRWGIQLIQKYYLIENYHGKKIWIEHGNRFDPLNKINRFGDIKETPSAYHYKRDFILKIVRAFEKNKKKTAETTWITDLAHFHPYKKGPYWFFSNYFYRELTPSLRYIVAPFFVVFLLGWKIIKTDFKQSLLTYGINPNHKIKLKNKKTYLRGIKKFLAKHKKYDLYIFGDHHTPFLNRIQIGETSKIIGNCGTWAKSFRSIRSWFKLPSVYLPYYKLSFISIEQSGEGTSIALDFVSKKSPHLLTVLEKIAILFKKRELKLTRKKIIF